MGYLREWWGSYEIVILSLVLICIVAIALLGHLCVYNTRQLEGRLNGKMKSDKKPVALLATLQSFEV
jgi:hypothetical protein